MLDFEEREIAGLTVRIDRNLCVGFETCIDHAPEVLGLDEDGIAIFLDDAGFSDRERLMEACRSCPVDALVVLDGQGTVLVPD